VESIYTSCYKKKARPSYIKAAKPDVAIPLYKNFIKSIELVGKKCKLVFFGADMKVSLLNDGPVTILIDKK
jgi:D-tyrosyl-tRNA(Tyr) deacylase